MKPIDVLLLQLADFDVQLWVEGESLRIRAPQGRLTPALRSELAKRKAEILAFLRQVEIAAAPGQRAIRPVARDGHLPLSFAQQRLWFLDQLSPGSWAYNMTIVYRLTGPLDRAALQRSLDEIVRRHESLRTTFASVDGEPVQVIAAPAGPAPLRLVDLQTLPGVERENAAARLVQGEAGRPFDLSRGPLLRVLLLSLGQGEHVLSLVIHHIVSDVWSQNILWQELAALYKAYSQAESPAPAQAQRGLLPDLPIQYADYAVWQRGWLQGEVLEGQLGYWREQLAGASVTELPPDRPRPAVQTFAGASHGFTLPRRLREELESLSREEGVTLFMTLLAAFQLLVSRYTGQEDLVVGTPVAGRTRTETERLVGFFVNSLVLRADLSGNPTFADLLGRVREVCLAAYSHQDLPFERLVQELHPERDPSRNPLFQISFALQNAPRQPLELEGLTVTPFPVQRMAVHADLECHLWNEPAGMAGLLRYNTDLFDAGTVERLAGHYQVLLEGIVADPEQDVGTLPLLTKDERRGVLMQWNGARADYPRDRSVHLLFEAQVDETPAAVAVVSENRRLTYGELNARANRLAWRLRRLGVGPEEPIGLLVDRTLEMMVGLLGILKAGGALVPLDPSSPSSRMGFIAADTGMKVVLTTAEFQHYLADLSCPRMMLDDLAMFEGEPGHNPDFHLSAGMLAYILYTSGSTGQPKGVMVEHRQLLGYLFAVVERYGFRRGDHFAMLQPLTVDSCHTMIFPALGFGGTVHLITRERSLDANALVADFRRQPMDHLKIAPSHLSALLAADPNPALLPRRTLIVGGEPVHWSLIDRLRQLGAQCAIWDHYGPTETTVGVLTYPVQAAEGRSLPHSDYQEEERRMRALTVPVGWPLANVRACVLDRRAQPVPMGAPGELYIGGDLVARGYLRRPEQTAQVFLADPLAAEPGARWYRTGDRVRMHPDGAIEFLGRDDDQVKLHGLRVELGEIEAALGGHRGVADRVVVLRQDSADRQPYLAAYCVPQPGQVLDSQEIRSFLKARLPDHMVPAAIVLLPQGLPRTAHGKTDRRLLPTPDQGEILLARLHVAPRTPVEETLAGIWCQVLGLERVGVHDSFFELGGHSLLAIQVIARIRSALQIEVPLRHLFERPTVAGLASAVEAMAAPAAEFDVRGSMPVAPSTGRPAHGYRIPRRDDQEPAPLSFSQWRFWFLDRFFGGSPAFNTPRVHRVRGPLDVPALEKSLREIVRRHQILRTAYRMEDGQPVQVTLPVPELSLDLVDLHDAEGGAQEAATRLLQAEIHRPFDLEAGCPIRTRLLRLGPDEHVLFLVIHHIGFDAWSEGVLYREIACLYQAYARRLPSPLDELPIQYADFAGWQRGSAQGDFFGEELAYWREQLAGIQPLELPLDYPRPAVQTHRAMAETLALPQDLSEKLASLGGRQGVTPFMILLAAFKLLAHRYTGQRDIVVGAPVAGRDWVEVEGLIGCFLNHLVLRTDLSGEGPDHAVPTFRQLLRQLGQVTLEAYAHQRIPFERLLEEIKPARDLSRTPLFQVFFNMHNVGERALELPGLVVEPFPLPERRSNFDLTIYYHHQKFGAPRITLVYNPDLFSQARMAEMAAQYGYLLEQVVADPGRPIDSYSLVTAASERLLPDPTQPLSAEWMGSVQSRLARHAQRAPDHLAVVDEHERWSYGELERRSNQLAHRLIAGGIRPGEVVAIYGHRSAALVWAVLGVMRAGAAFLILDPAYPAARLVHYLRQAQPRGWIRVKAAGPLPEKLEEYLATASLCCRVALPRQAEAEAAGLMEEYSSDDPGVTVGADDLAYIAFTSGSTGEPKGILGLQGPLTHFLPWQAERFGLGSADRLSMVSGLSHDPLQRDIFTALWLGATLCIPDDDTIGTPGRLADWMAEQAITFANLTPAMGQLLAEGADPDLRLNSLRYVFFIGDKLTWRDVVRLQRLAPRATAINLYGTTETVRALSYYVVAPGTKAEAVQQVCPVGREMPGMQLLVLNRARQMAGVGELGELCIRSPHLARGYLGDDGLTRERFIINPFTGVEGDRVYRTGDLGRYLPYGNVEFYGRADRQIKIRGYRVEPAEVEAALEDHPAVRQSVVVLRDDVPGGEGLVAYVVRRSAASDSGGDEEPRPRTAALRAFLQSRLPEYMIPGAYVFLDALPLLPNGKVDQGALPAPDRTSSEMEARFVPPRNETEQRIAGIWAEVLRVDRQIGAHDDFFQLGGHSLLAMRVVARVRQAFQVELPVRRLFELPTVAQLGEHIDGEMRVPSSRIAPLSRRAYRMTRAPSGELLAVQDDEQPREP